MSCSPPLSSSFSFTVISLLLPGTTVSMSVVSSSRRRWSSPPLLQRISSTVSIQGFGPVGCSSPCLSALFLSGHTLYVPGFQPSTCAIVVLTLGFRPSIQSSPLGGFLHLYMATITSCFDLLSSGSVFLSQSYSHSSRGTSTLRGRLVSIPMTWIFLIGTTKSNPTWTLFMKPTLTVENRWKTAFWSLRPIAAIRPLR